jgi:hypothetical protein
LDNNIEPESRLKWNERDWKWVIGILLSIIILILTIRLGDNQDVINLFSFISSSVSIALALVAIFIALKQDGESRRVNYLTTRILNSIEFKLNNVDENLKRIDEKVIRNVTEETIEEYTSEEGEKEHYTKDEVKELLNNLSVDITKEINRELKNKYENTTYFRSSNIVEKGYQDYLTILVKSLLERSPGISVTEIKELLYKRHKIDIDYTSAVKLKARAIDLIESTKS